MELLFLGTGAADWRQDERKENEFFRGLTSTLIDGHLLVDPGPTVLDFCERNGYSGLLGEVTDMLVTHSHEDHLSPGFVEYLCGSRERNVWCNRASAEKLKKIKNCNIHLMAFPDVCKVGEYTVTALRANHSPIREGEESLIYTIENGEKCLFYGLDTSWLPCESWFIMRKKKFDGMIIEITLGDGIGDRRIFEHTNIRMAEEMLATFRSVDIMKPGCKVFGTHFSRFAHEDHERLSKRLESFGVTAAYDGYRDEI